jgi:tetratricopeptide (TPR) repeat protein
LSRESDEGALRSYVIMRVAWVVALLCAVVAGLAHAAPFVPVDDREVLEALPEQRDPALGALKRLQRASRAAPNDLAVATRFARGAIEASRSTGDPRYLGWAQSALGPWWTGSDAPAQALLLRATVKQSLHDFEGALRDLDRLLASTPRDGQARLTRATVRTVLGRYADALADCDALEGQALALVTATCRADAASRSGRAEEAYGLVTRALDGARVDAGVRAWAATLAAEIAARRGDGASAERYFRHALVLDADDPYALGAYADWLLDAGRPGDAAALLQGRTRNDGLLLRRVLALQALPDRNAYEAARIELAARVDAARRRGDGVHRREEARYALAIEQDPVVAVKLARANWSVQREPADLRILAESARTAGDASALRIVSDWVSATRLEDVRIQTLLKGGA